MGQDSAGFFRLQICDMTSQMGSMGKLSNNPWTHIFLRHYSKWWFPKIGLPPVIIHFRWVFSMINHLLGIPQGYGKPRGQEGQFDAQGLGRISWASDVGRAHIGPHDLLAERCFARCWDFLCKPTSTVWICLDCFAEFQLLKCVSPRKKNSTL